MSPDDLTKHATESDMLGFPLAMMLSLRTDQKQGVSGMSLFAAFLSMYIPILGGRIC